MFAIARLSGNFRYENRLNDSTVEDDSNAIQPLLGPAEVNESDETELLIINEPIEQAYTFPFRFSIPTDRFEPYIQSHADLDQKNYASLILSAFCLGASIATFSLHCIEKYHENHKEILATHMINILFIIFRDIKYVFSCPRYYIAAVKIVKEWLQPKLASEQGMILANRSRMVQQSTNFFWPVIQWWARLDNNYYYSYYALIVVSGITAALGCILHFIEKDHENHMAMLWLEGVNIFVNLLLTSIQGARIAVQKWGQPSLPPQNFIYMPNYQTV